MTYALHPAAALVHTSLVVNVGEALRETVQALLLRQHKKAADLARDTGMKPNTISGFLNGRRGMSLDNIEALRVAFRVEPWELFCPRQDQPCGPTADPAPQKAAAGADSSDRPRVSPNKEVAMSDSLDAGRTIAGLWTQASPRARAEMYAACVRIAEKDLTAVDPVSKGGEGNG